jgi:hypothetical protein
VLKTSRVRRREQWQSDLQDNQSRHCPGQLPHSRGQEGGQRNFL